MRGPIPREAAIVAIGSNLGNSLELIHRAMAFLEGLSDEPILKSSVWETSPVDCPPDSPRFLNAVVALIPKENETPESLLGRLQEAEKLFGRKRGPQRNAPRPLDLDLISFGAEMRQTPTLTLPHPRAILRRFVLVPLTELDSSYRLPGQGRTVETLISDLPPDMAMRRLSPI
jgi:2-amino-4-hydroxy-6-hydroxymethyldihydropteridine diphosphokinase